MSLVLPPYDTHVHSYLSGHSDERMKPELIRDAALRKRLEAVVLLEHVPQIFPKEQANVWYERKNNRSHIDELLVQIDKVKSGKPRLIKGAEVDADPIMLDGTVMLDDLSGLEFPAFATHVVPGGKVFWYDVMPLPPVVAEEVLTKFVDCVKSALASGKFRVWVHPGALIARAGLLEDFSPRNIEVLEEIFAVMADNDVAFELNELLAKKISGPYLDTYVNLVEAARSWGLRFVVGSDAHSPETIGVFKWVPSIAERAYLGKEDFLGLDELLQQR